MSEDKAESASAPAPSTKPIPVAAAAVKEALPKVEAAVLALPERIEAAINEWLHEHIANSPASAHVEVWNHITSRLGALRDRILKEV